MNNADYKQYALNKFCEFKSREVEADFMEYEKTANLGIVRFLILVMCFTYATLVISDFYSLAQQRVSLISLGFRGAGLATAIFAFFLAGKFSRYDHTLLFITLSELTVFALYLLDIHLQKTVDPILQFMAVMLIILTVFLIPNRWKNSAFAGLIIWTGYIISCMISQVSSETPTLAQRGFYLAICFLSCAIFVYGRESSERRHFASERILELMSITDRLTGIFNRARFEFVLGAWIKNRRHDPFCLLLLDIDDFKKVNDTLGHNAGDTVLVETTKVITACIRDEDIFARWGGEEFVILFDSVSIEKGAELAERLRKSVENNTCGEAGKITISIGVAQYQGEDKIEDFVRRADEKMYESKKAGKNRVST